jgi:pseudaminic acid biosynthesis-associated methylase
MTNDPGNSDQLRFWRGDFGNEYTDRNANSSRELRARVALWAPIMARLEGAPPRRILEVGANIGNNLRALRQISDAEFFAIEPNEKARGVLVDDGVVPQGNVRDGFAAAIDLPDDAVDLAFTSGVLIHIHPDDLLASCSEIHRVSARYVVCIEYFSDKAEEITYRGHSERLFKRDFGGFWMDSFPDLQILDYGFAWKRTTGLDNLTWWLMEKR